jgi:cation transport regulator ChaC
MGKEGQELEYLAAMLEELKAMREDMDKQLRRIAVRIEEMNK